MKLTNIYKNIITNLEYFSLQTLLDNTREMKKKVKFTSSMSVNKTNSWFRKCQNKQQIYVYEHRYNNIVYYSNKYKRYQYVAVRSIYGRGDHIDDKENLKVYNPDQLDLYYDTIFTYNRCNVDNKFEKFEDDDFQDFFGDKIFDLVIIEPLINAGNSLDIQHYDLYYNDSLQMTNIQNSLDVPVSTYGESVEESDSNYIFKFNTKYPKFYLGQLDIYDNLSQLYNYIYTSPDDMDVVSVNDKWSFITQLKTDLQYDKDILLSGKNNKPIQLNEENSLDIENILGTELYGAVMVMFSIIYRHNYTHMPITSIADDNLKKELRYSEQLFLNEVLKGIDSFAIRSMILAKQYDSINAISEPITFDSNGLCCITIGNNIPFIQRKTTDFDNAEFIIPEKLVVNRFQHLFDLFGSKYFYDRKGIDYYIYYDEYGNIKFKKLEDVDDINDKYYSFVDIELYNSIDKNNQKNVTYALSEFDLDSTTLVEYNITEKQHVDFVDYNVTKGRKSNYSTLLDQADSTISDRLEMVNYDILIKDFKVNDFLINNYLNVDDKRFRISGFSLDIDNSNASSMSKLIHAKFGESKDDFIYQIRELTKNDSVRVIEYPLPVLSNNIQSYINVNTPALVNTIHSETDYNEIYIDNKFKNGLDFIQTRDVINNLINNPSSSINEYDKGIYKTYNLQYGNFDLLQIRNMKNFYVVFMIIDTYTGKKDFIQVDLLSNVKSIGNSGIIDQMVFDKNKKMFNHGGNKFDISTDEQINMFFSNYESFPKSESTVMTSKVITNSEYTNQFPVYLTKLVIKRGDYLNGNLTKFVIKNAKCFDPISKTYQTVDITINYDDFIKDGQDLKLDITAKIPDKLIMEYFETEFHYTKMYKNFDYVDKPTVQYFFNIKNFFATQQYSIRASFIAFIDSALTITRINVKSKKLECLPSESYNSTIGLEIFDINDIIQDYAPDNKLCMVLNNFIGNSIGNNLNLSSFDTTAFNTSDVMVLDKLTALYTRYEQQLKTLPFMKSPDSIDKYIRVYVKASIPDESKNIIDNFKFMNRYNLALENDDGVLMLDGQLSDYKESMGFDDLLKLYRTDIIFSIFSNVVTTMEQPIHFDLICKIYDDKSKYIANDGTTLPTINDFFNIKIYNRGDQIQHHHDQYPRILKHIEFNEIYPQYDWQEKKDYIYTIEYQLKSQNDKIKVSELYFDVCFMTDDIQVGIPVDYTSLDNPLNATEFDQVTDKETILYYFNQLIRHVCPNCTDAHFSIKVKIIPSMYGFNISNLTISSYTYNIKLEEKLPYIFYKESADAIMILDKKSDMDTDKIELDPEVRKKMQEDLAGDIPIDSEGENKLSNYITSINVPSNTKGHQLIFNSSFYPKKLIVTLENNTSNKTIKNIKKEYSFPAFDFRIITFEEKIKSADYVGGFAGGLATYKVEEVSTHLDTTTVLPNEKLQLPIPSYDEAMSRVMSFIDKSSKLIEMKYKKNVNVKHLEPEKPSSVETKSHAVHIVEINNDIYQQDKYGQVLDIDRRFYLERSYLVKIPLDDMSYFAPFFKQFDPQIALKVPLSALEFNIQCESGDGSILTQNNDIYAKILSDSTGINEDFNNYFDLSTKWLWLIGERTDINEFTFKFSGYFYYENNDILSRLTDEYEVINSFGFQVNKTFIDPNFILNMLFGSYGTDLINYTIDTFINNDPVSSSVDYDQFVAKLVSDVGDRYTEKSNNKNTVFNTVFSMSSKTTIDRNKIAQLLESEKITSIMTDPFITFINKDGSRDNQQIKQASPFKEPELQKYKTADKQLSLVTTLFESDNNDEKLAIKKQLEAKIDSPSESPTAWEGWTFEKIYDFINNSPYTRMFSGENIVKVPVKLYRNDSLAPLTSYNFSMNCDGETSQINSVYFGEKNGESDVGYIDPVGDKTKMYKREMPMEIEFNNFKQVKCHIKMNEKRLTLTNLIYPIYSEFQEKLIANPVSLLSYADSKFTIVQDTNYKKWFQIPLDIFKGVDAYLTIDKIKVVDNYISNNDYHVTFGTHNERYIIKGSGEVSICKIITKFEHGLRCMIEVFNIANTTGAYNTSLLIYYTFNGKQYIEKSDIKYDIILPDALDNEYLIVNVDRMDYINNVLDGDNDDKSYPKEYFNVRLGTPGCNTSYPDYTQHKESSNINKNDMLGQLANNPNSSGLNENLEQLKDL